MNLEDIKNLSIHRKSIDIYNDLKSLIYEGYTIDFICEASSNINIYTIIDILINNCNNDITILNAIKEYYNNLKIKTNKCLIISDTHIGRILSNEDPFSFMKSCYYNESGLYYAYNYALRNHIPDILHLGDLIEGNSDVTVNRINPLSQIIYLKRIYPNTPEIQTYLLYGNHDFNAIYFSDVKDNDFYKACNNMKLIGVNYSYVNINGNLIKLSHESKLSKCYSGIELPHIYEFAGHSHMSSHNEEQRYIDVPSLSCASQNINDIGFMELTDEENNYIVKLFDREAKYKKEYVLTK